MYTVKLKECSDILMCYVKKMNFIVIVPFWITSSSFCKNRIVEFIPFLVIIIRIQVIATCYTVEYKSCIFLMSF